MTRTFIQTRAVMRGTIYLITVYPKSAKENLTDAERNEIKRMRCLQNPNLSDIDRRMLQEGLDTTSKYIIRIRRLLIYLEVLNNG